MTEHTPPTAEPDEIVYEQVAGFTFKRGDEATFGVRSVHRASQPKEA